MTPLSRAFLVEPLESVFFGPPRSFSAGEAHRADSTFPPSPFTFQGLVRSQLLRGVQPPLDLDDWSGSARRERESLIGTPDALPSGWQLQGPFPAKIVPAMEPEVETQVNPWVPAPRFLLHPPDQPVHARPISSLHPGLNDLGSDEHGNPTLLLGRPELENAGKPLEGWIDPENLYFALTGEGSWQEQQYSPDLPPFVKREYQPGLAIDPSTGTARHGMLYFLQSVRFNRDCGLLGVLKGSLNEPLSTTALQAGTGSAGRKGRLVRFMGVEDYHPAWKKLMEGAHLPDSVAEDATFWLLALTAVRLADARSPEIHLADAGNVRLRILAALTGHPTPIGGYRMATGQSRPNRLYVPAGSAWLIRLEGGTPTARSECLRQLNNTHPLGPREEAAFGFGHTLLGLGPSLPKENL